MYSKNRYYSYTVLLVVVLLSACSTGKNYQRPELNTPASFSEGSVSHDTSVASQSWRTFFTDSTLVTLIDKAVQHNFDLQLYVKQVEISHAFAKQARLAWLPALGLQVTASTSNPSQKSLNGISLDNFLGASHVEDYTVGANLSWQIDVWGKIRRQKEAALASYLETYEARRAVETEIVAQVADGYYNLLMMDTQLEVARRNVALSDSIVAIIQLQKTAGEVTELAVQQAIAQRQDAELLIPQLQQAIALQENALHFLIGEMPGSVLRNAELNNLRTETPLSTGVPADLLRFRPDVRSREHALRSANARLGVAQANFYPSLLLTGSGGLNAFKATEWFTAPASLFGTMAGSLLQPVFQRRLLQTQLEVAKAEREQQVIQFRQSVTGAVHDVTNALVKLEKLEEQQRVATSRLQTLQHAVVNARLLFASGMANYLEVISAQSRSLDAELEQVSITRHQLSARVELYQALGGGWQ
jgi:outer membrane protein, multidrug efflux system